jgi:ferredoxin
LSLSLSIVNRGLNRDRGAFVKFTVDLGQCENHGQCTLVAPELFSLDDNGLLAFRAVATDSYTSEELSAEQAAAAKTAGDTCPMQAISLSQ